MTDLIDAPAPTIPTEPTTPIKPSEALRLGRLIAPRHTLGNLFDGNDGACALGAMHLGWGGSPDDFDEPNLWLTSPAQTSQRLADADINMLRVTQIFDFHERDGEDGDAAVLAYLEELGQ